MMYDSFHAHIEEKDQAQRDRLVCGRDDPRPRLGERPGHPRDRPGRTGTASSSGLKQSGYNGYLTIEAFGRALPALAAATQGLARPVPRPDGALPRRAGLHQVADLNQTVPASNRSHRTQCLRSTEDGATNRPEDPCHARFRRIAWAVVGLCLVPLALGQAPATARSRSQGDRPPAKAQPRPHGQRVKVDPAAITVEDGDGVVIRWSDQDTEIVRILGIDTPGGPAARAQPALRPAVRPGGAGVRPGGVRRRDRGRAAALARRSTPTAAPWLTCSSTAGTTRSWRSRPATRPRRSATTATTACPRSGRGRGRREGRRPAALRAAAPVPRPDARRSTNWHEGRSGQVSRAN